MVIRQLLGVVLVFVTPCVICLGAQVNARPTAAEARIAAAEEAGSAFPRAEGASVASSRKCLSVRSDQIVFPTTQGYPASYRLVSGEFSAASLSFGWDQTYEQAKMPLTPEYPTKVGNGLTLSVTRIDPPGETLRFDVSGFPRNEWFFPAWPRFPTPGRWMIVATAGVNWGCFVIDRPVK